MRVGVWADVVLEHGHGADKQRHPEHEDAVEEVWLGGDELAAVEDELLLQHGPDYVGGLHPRVQRRVDLLRRARSVELLEVVFSNFDIISYSQILV